MKMVKCLNCRQHIVLPATICAHCGADLSGAIQKQTAEAKIRQIRQAYEADWLRDSNVVSVATRKDADGVYYIAVGVERLEASVSVPKSIEGVPVRIEPVGQIYTVSNTL